MAAGSIVAILLLAGGTLCAMALAAAGDLDPSFGNGGLVQLDPQGPVNGEGRAVAVQPDGKIVITATPRFMVGGGDFDLGVWRFEADGDPDPNFGVDGLAILVLPGDQEGRAVALQPDGKIVVAGEDLATRRRFIVARLEPDGKPDLSFNGGHAIVEFGAGTDALARAVAVQKDGRIVAAGVAADANGSGFALARLTPGGLPDPSFGSGGRVVTSFPPVEAEANAVALQKDGKIVAAGSIFGDGIRDFALARYLADGRLDPSFSGDGRATTDIGGDDQGLDVAIQRDGRIVAAGFFEPAAPADATLFALARFLPNGRLDRSFGGDGRVATEFPDHSVAFASTLVVQKDGRIVAAGGAREGNDADDLALARYLPNGRLDRRFGTGGRVTQDLGADDQFLAAALQPDGRLVVSGFSDSGFISMVIARYLTR
jgi:uncharacterized delta-60 repeat protein